MLIGSGLPMVSVRMPIMLWKCAVVRMPPLNHVEYGAPRALRHAGLPFGEEPLEHHRADDVDAGDRVGMLVVVERIAERRREHHRALRPGLVMVVHDLRIPLAIHDAVDVASDSASAAM